MPKQPAKKIEPEETVSDQVTVDFNGSTFSIPRDTDDWPTTAYMARIKAATTGRIADWMEFMELLLGASQWQLLTTAAAPRAGDFRSFMDTFSTTVREECSL